MFSLALTQSDFKSLALLGSFLALELAVSVKVELLIFDYVVTCDITFLSSAQVGLDAF